VLLAGQLLGAPAALLIGKLPGVACIMGTSMMFALGAVFTKRYPLRLPPVTNVAWQVFLGSLPLLLASLLFDRWDFGRVTPIGWAGLGYGAVLALGVSYLAWFRALRLLPASTAATATLMVPLIGVLGSAALLGEPLGARQLVALAMTLAGVALAARAR
jgi:drug/metabolite transporter (DMT)-like permease